MAASVTISDSSSDTPVRERSHQDRTASDEALFQSALSLLANPLGTTSPAATLLFQACEIVAGATGITLKMPATGGGQTLQDIAHVSCIRLRCVRLRSAWWKRDMGPLLAYRESRPLALLPTKSGAYQAVDPVSGVREAIDERMAAGIDPKAYIFYGALLSGRSSLAGLARDALRGSYSDIFRMLSSSAVAGALGLATPIMIAWLAGTVIPGGDRGQLFTAMGGLVAAGICSALFNLSAALAVQRTSTRSAERIMAAIWNRGLTLPAWFFRQFNAADLALRALSVDRARESLANIFLSGGLACVFSLLHVILLIRFAPALALPAIALAGAVAVVSAVCGWMFCRQQTVVVECESRAAGQTLEFVQGIAKLRVAGAERRAFCIWAHAFAQERRESIRTRRISVLVAAVQAAVPLAGWILIASLASGEPSLRAHPGLLLAFCASFQQLLAGALQLSGFFQLWAQISALTARAKPLLECAPESHSDRSDPGPLLGGLEVRDLSFRYERAGSEVLNALSFRIEPGEFVAFVGSSGSGKSTLLRLLLGFERPDSGAISYDGRDLTTLDPQAVRRQLGVVLQDGRLLTGDMGSNILGATGLGLDKAWKAAELAGIADEIRAMPMGMHTQLANNGSGLSGGQRQRILLARALVHQPRILLLDEATSALDNRTQAAVAGRLEHMGATRIVIAHRLSTIMQADRIFVLKSGRIVESGTYADLWARGGAFHELVRHNKL